MTAIAAYPKFHWSQGSILDYPMKKIIKYYNMIRHSSLKNSSQLSRGAECGFTLVMYQKQKVWRPLQTKRSVYCLFCSKTRERTKNSLLKQNTERYVIQTNFLSLSPLYMVMNLFWNCVSQSLLRFTRRNMIRKTGHIMNVARITILAIEFIVI